MKLLIIYWSGTGNTQEMAEDIKKGAEEFSAEVTLKLVSDALPTDLDGYERIALGCPSMGDEVLEEGEMEPFVEAIEGMISGKKIGLFGSYGWGDGQWMRDWEERMSDNGAMVIGTIITNGSPDSGIKEELKSLGKELVR